MRREDAELLTSHYYKLYTSIRPVVDTSPPVSLYTSPKSTFYRPFAMRKQHNPQSITRRRGQEEINHFLALRRTRSHSQLGFNSFAQPKTELHLNLSEGPQVRSRLLGSRHYQPSFRLRLHPGDHSSSSSDTNGSIKPLPLPLLSKDKRIRNVRKEHTNEYDQFKDRVLSEILLRNVFTSRVIEDTFRREIAKHPELEKAVLLEIMSETLTELGIYGCREGTKASQKHVTISDKERKRCSTSVSSGSRVSSSYVPEVQNQMNGPKQASLQVPQQKTPSNHVSNGPVRLNVSPPSSLSSDIDEIVRRLSSNNTNTTVSYDTIDKEPNLSEFETSSSEEEEEEETSSDSVVERTKRKV